LSVLSRALALQPGSTHRLPPPWALHLSVLPSAPFGQPGSTHRFRGMGCAIERTLFRISKLLLGVFGCHLEVCGLEI